MSLSDQIALYIAIFTGLAAIATVAGFIYAWVQYLRDQRQQRAAQTREALQAIVEDCSQFLRPLSEQYPYPILHTATAITKEFCSRMGKKPQGEDVQALLHNKELLLSICVEGWINSTQIFRMLGIVEELERKATSHYLRGKLLLMCDASFLLAGLVAQICSPKSFYDMLIDLELQKSPQDQVEDMLNSLTVKLQQRICKEFNDHYKDIITLSLHFIQTAAGAFINLTDTDLLDLAKAKEKHPQLSTPVDPHDKSEQVALLHKHFEWVKMLLDDLNPDASKPDGRENKSIREQDYTVLCNLMNLMKEGWDKVFQAPYAKQTAIMS